MKNDIIKILKKAGFETMTPISIPSGAVRISGNSFVAKSVSIREKFKYPHGNLRVTVGAKTVSFYKVHNKKPCDFVNFKTSELNQIKHFIKEIKNRFL